MENIFYVYFLIDPIKEIPFYIGKGKNLRAWAHLKGHANYNCKKLDYIKNLRFLGQEPQVKIVEENLSCKDALLKENFLIELHKGTITNLPTNPPPDRTGCKHTESHKKLLSLINKGKILSEDHKAKIGKANTHIPNYDSEKSYKDTSTGRGGSRNGRAKPIVVNGMTFGCMKHAYEFFGVSKPTFKLRYQFEYLD